MKNRFKNAKIGETVVFGNYYGPAEWLVLDEKEGKILLLSRYLLERRQFREKFGHTSWEESSLRKWLNVPFYEKVFSEEEKELIAKTKINTPPNGIYGTSGGNDTEDKIFLLSIEEAEKYFYSDESRAAVHKENAGEYGIPDEYCGKNGLWWLRTMGIDCKRAAVVGAPGYVYEIGSYVDMDYVSVRPAMWVKISENE